MLDPIANAFTRRRLLATSAAALATTSLVASLSTQRASAQVVPGPTVPPQQYTGFASHTISVSDAGGVLQRSFLVHIPLVIGPPMPAVIVFHGGGQNATDMIQHWESLIPTYKLVIVCPQ